jgi:NitT/TauT family transport system substrate-binding protein
MYNGMATVKSADGEILRLLNDPDLHYTTTPENVMGFADFMNRVGTLRLKPQGWKELFVPDLASQPGS